MVGRRGQVQMHKGAEALFEEAAADTAADAAAGAGGEGVIDVEGEAVEE